jgi:branched-chain amino acid transport system substrate-binding protein
MSGHSSPMVNRRGFLAAGAAGAAALGLGGRVGPLHAAEPLKIGLLLPMSGGLAREGQSCKRGADVTPALLAEMGMPVQLMIADTETNIDTARTRAEKLIADGAQVLIGAFDSAHTLAVAQVCEQRGVPLVINIAAAPNITEQGFKTVFRNFPTAPKLVTEGLALMKDVFKITGTTPTKAVFLHNNDTFGTAMAGAVNKLFPTLDMPFPLVETIAYDGAARDLAVEVGKAKATGADLVLLVPHGDDCIRVIREMVKQRFEPKAVVSPGSPGMYEAQFYKTLGKYSDYCMTNLPWINPKTAMSQALLKAFTKAYPDALFEMNIGYTFEAILIAADAAKRAGSNDPKAILAALPATNIAEHVMIGGPIVFDAKGQNTNTRSATIQNFGGKPLVVLPSDVAEAKPVFPAPGWQQRG